MTKAIVRLKSELIGIGRADYGLRDIKGNHYTIKCAPGFIEVPVEIAKELEVDSRVTVEYPGESKPSVTTIPQKVKKITKSEFTEEFIYSQNKAWQIKKIKELSDDKNAKIPKYERNRVKLILKLQKNP